MNLLKRITTGFTIFRLVMNDSRTPFMTKFLIGVALVYLLSPFDVVPDFFALFGQLDDIIMVPLIILTALKLIPPGVINKYREYVTDQKKKKEIR